MVCIVLVIYGLILCAGGVSSEQAPPRPLEPVVYATGSGQLELYWFYPGVHRDWPGNAHIHPRRTAFLGETSQNMAVATAFRIAPPFHIVRLGTFIAPPNSPPSGCGAFSDSIAVVLKGRVRGGGFIDLWRDTIGLDESALAGGELVYADVNITVNDRFEVYAMLEWLDFSPCSPWIGLNTGIRLLEQFLYVSDSQGGYLTYLSEEFITGLEIYDWTGSDGAGGGDSESVTFEIYYSPGSSIGSSSILLADSIGVDSCRCRIAPDSGGFVHIAAVSGQTRSFSDPVYIDPDQRAPLSVIPAENRPDPPDDARICLVNLRNFGSLPLPMTLGYDSTLVYLPIDSLTLWPGEQREIAIELTNLDVYETHPRMRLLVESGDRFYPVIYPITGANDIYLEVDSSDYRLWAGELKIGQPYPNPFNRQVTFGVISENRRILSLDVFNLLGQRISHDRFPVEGNDRVSWSPDRDGPIDLASGLYLFCFHDNHRVFIKKAVLLK